MRVVRERMREGYSTGGQQGDGMGVELIVHCVCPYVSLCVDQYEATVFFT
jgi:hypothetical protein